MKVAITLTSAAQTAISRMGGLSQNFLPAVARGVNLGLQVAMDRTLAGHFTGRGPFAPSLHKLGVRTGNLRRSFTRTPARIEGGTVRAAIGTTSSYFPPHEYGFSGSVSVRAHTRTTKKSGGRGAGGKFQKAVTNTITVRSHKRELNIPERAPLRTGFKANAGAIGLAISREIVGAYKGGLR
jgi:hypothetical protein